MNYERAEEVAILLDDWYDRPTLGYVKLTGDSSDPWYRFVLIQVNETELSETRLYALASVRNLTKTLDELSVSPDSPCDRLRGATLEAEDKPNKLAIVFQGSKQWKIVDVHLLPNELELWASTLSWSQVWKADAHKSELQQLLILCSLSSNLE